MKPFKTELNIIIADDDSVTRSVLRLLLVEHGCRVVGEANDGEKAIELCDSERPHLVFLDINMPKLDGHQTAERLRLSSPGVGLIMISSSPTLDNVQKALQSGASGFVVKPFNATKVVEAINHCLRQKRPDLI